VRETEAGQRAAFPRPLRQNHLKAKSSVVVEADLPAAQRSDLGANQVRSRFFKFIAGRCPVRCEREGCKAHREV